MFAGNSFGSVYFGQIWSGSTVVIGGEPVTGDILLMYDGDILQPDTGRVRGAGRPHIEHPNTGVIKRGKVGA